jgi:UDP-N-acetylmuramoyl-tripeptide--D-alanyl-D-alanine ligase
MVRKVKDVLYFLVARYFRFFAALYLKRWAPRIVVITGSNGKTTALNLLEVQLGAAARYSHGANSSFGIPFDILGLKRFNYSVLEWPAFALRAPFAVWRKPYAENIYVVEADCDRPYEGDFLASLLKPEVVVWLSCARTHSMHFEKSVRAGRFATVDDAIAHEFGYFIERSGKLCIVNADEPRIEEQLSRTSSAVHHIHRAELQQYAVSIGGTEFVINGTRYRAPLLLPQEVFYSIAASVKVAQYFDVRPTSELWKLRMPPSRSSILKGKKNTVLIDSTYNANVGSVRAIIEMVGKFPSKETWVILGDLIEQGSQTKEEHEKVARMLQGCNFKKVILVGPRMRESALPLIAGAVAFDEPRAALDYIEEELKGGETLVFKGARFLEGIVEHLLADKADADKLCRREAVWRKRRAQWGL